MNYTKSDILADTLRPAFGLGEDWNFDADGVGAGVAGLRPAFGLGEDWNFAMLT